MKVFFFFLVSLVALVGEVFSSKITNSPLDFGVGLISFFFFFSFFFSSQSFFFFFTSQLNEVFFFLFSLISG